METIFPTATGFQGFFLVGFRKQPTVSTQTERVGTALLKRTYTINAGTGVLTPTAAALPVFMTDQLVGTTVRYEHDLAAFKPQADLIVVGFTQQAGVYQVQVNGTLWLSRFLLLPGGAMLFGWEPRINDANPERRQVEAGGYSANPADYPLQWPVVDAIRDPLPGGPGDPRTPVFNNRFYNGYLRTAAVAAPFPFLPAGAAIDIRRNGVVAYPLQLGNEAISARYLYYTGRGPDEACGWRGRTFAVHLDTLVVEPEINRCYVVWRGVWNFDEQPAAAYRRLVVVAA